MKNKECRGYILPPLKEFHPRNFKPKFSHIKGVHTHVTIYTTHTKIQNFVLQTTASLNRKGKAYGIQSPLRRSFSNVYSIYLCAEGKLH